MTSRNTVPSNYLDVKNFFESRGIKISDIINELVKGGKDYERWFKNLLHEDMYESWFAKYYQNILTKVANRSDYKNQSQKELSNYGIARFPFEFKQDVEVSTLFEDWIRLKLEKSGIDNLKSNDKATQSDEDKNANTYEDFVYVSDSGESVPVELKNRFTNNLSIQFRDGADRVKTNGSLVFVYYPYKSKASIVDFSDEFVVNRIKPNDAYGKSGEKVDLKSSDFFDFDICSNNLSILKDKIEETLAKRVK